MKRIRKIILFLQLLPLYFIVEISLFLNIPMERHLRLLRSLPFTVLKLKDTDIVKLIDITMHKAAQVLHRSVPVCLRCSLMKYAVFNKKYASITLFIGVNRDNKIFSAHSWLEICNKPFFEPGDTVKRYKVLGAFK